MSLVDRLRHCSDRPAIALDVLWLGLATLIVGLIVLTRTNWGQSHPLRKCAALSLLVHLLLAAYATTVQIVTVGIARRPFRPRRDQRNTVDDPSYSCRCRTEPRPTPKSAGRADLESIVARRATVPTTLAMTRPDTAAEPTQPEPKLAARTGGAG